VNVDVTGVNDAPVLGDYTVSLAENSANGTAVETVSASDVDGDSPTYSITGGNTGSAFAINSTSGAITVADGNELDYETTTQYTLTVTASDGNGGSDTLDGGAGNDALHGGIGADTFMFSVASGKDVILDFQNNIDQIEIDVSLLVEVNPVAEDLRSYAQRNEDNDIVLVFDDETSLTFAEVQTTTAILDDAVFV
jgi:Ca2+-binding RTX toxin-like protein